jgi:glycogen synthase
VYLTHSGRVVGRVAGLALPALRRILGDTDVQFVLLGAGDPDLDYEFWRLGKDFSAKAKVFQGYNAALAQRIYAGCDVFLMPSHFEPCGIGQMIAMRYGALPLVRETGGLADTVQNYDNGDADRGVGFVFSWETPDAVLGTLHWALATYHNKRDAWRRMQRRGGRWHGPRAGRSSASGTRSSGRDTDHWILGIARVQRRGCRRRHGRGWRRAAMGPSSLLKN